MKKITEDYNKYIKYENKSREPQDQLRKQEEFYTFDDLLAVKKIASSDSDFYKELEILQEKIYQIDQHKKTEYLILYSKLLLILAGRNRIF